MTIQRLRAVSPREARPYRTRRSAIAATAMIALGLTAVSTFVGVAPASAAPTFQMPFICGQSWKAATYGGHQPSYYAVDWNNDNGDAWERGQPVLASAPGTVVTSAYDGTAYGNYVVIDHGAGWRTLYAHLSARSVSGGSVAQAQQIGTIGGTPNWPVHLHYEQRLNDVVQAAAINGSPIAYTTTYNGNPYTSKNGCTSSPAYVRYYTTGTVNLRTGPGTGYAIVRAVGANTPIDVVCQAWGTDVGGNRIWDRLTGGEWVADYWTTTPSWNNLAPPYRWC